MYLICYEVSTIIVTLTASLANSFFLPPTADCLSKFEHLDFN